MLITVLFDVLDKDEQVIIEEGLDVDIEVTDEEFERIRESVKSHKCPIMCEDEELQDICDRCFDTVIEKGILGPELYDRALGNIEEHLELLFDYPIEIIAENAVHMPLSGFDAPVYGCPVPEGTKYIELGDGKFKAVRPGEAEKAFRELLNKTKYMSVYELKAIITALRILVDETGDVDGTIRMLDRIIEDLNGKGGSDNEE